MQVWSFFGFRMVFIYLSRSKLGRNVHLYQCAFPFRWTPKLYLVLFSILYLGSTAVTQNFSFILSIYLMTDWFNYLLCNCDLSNTGYFEFKICPTNNPHVKETQSCFDQHPVSMADGSGTRYKVTPGNNMKNIDVVLPSNLVCDFCVLQWRYHAGQLSSISFRSYKMLLLLFSCRYYLVCRPSPVKYQRW